MCVCASSGTTYPRECNLSFPVIAGIYFSSFFFRVVILIYHLHTKKNSIQVPRERRYSSRWDLGFHNRKTGAPTYYMTSKICREANGKLHGNEEKYSMSRKSNFPASFPRINDDNTRINFHRVLIIRSVK